MRNFKFNKENDNRWYVELSEWTGSKADLEMVAGADTMLEYMAEGENYVNLYISEKEFEGSDVLLMIRLATELDNGAFYNLKTYKGIEISLELWLCDVTSFLFGKMPEKIYILKSNLNNH